MPRAKNPTIGSCPCSMRGCDETADVRKLGNSGKLYLFCPSCKTIRPEGERFQEYILANATMIGAESVASNKDTQVEKGTEPEPVPDPAEAGPAPETPTAQHTPPPAKNPVRVPEPMSEPRSNSSTVEDWLL